MFGDGGERVDDGGGVHPQLHAETDQEAQVAVARGERGDQDAEAQSEASHHHQQHGGDQDPGVGLHWRSAQHEVGQEEQEEQELDAEGDQVRDQDGEGDSQAREVDLAEQPGVADEGVGGLVEAIGKIAPDDGAREVEQEGRQVVGGQAGDVAEDDGEDQGGQDGLDQVPERSQDGLFVDGDEVAPHEEQHQVTVAPQLVQAQVPPGALRADDHVPVLVGGSW